MSVKERRVFSHKQFLWEYKVGEQKECEKENFPQTKEEKKKEEEEKKKEEEEEKREEKSLLTKTILMEVDADKCENKEEIALTAISSLKPFAGLSWTVGGGGGGGGGGGEGVGGGGGGGGNWELWKRSRWFSEPSQT